MTDYDFVLDKNALTLATTTLKNGVKHLENIWRTVENVKTNIHSNWVGQSADAYVDKLFAQKTEFTRRTEEIKVLIKDLEYITNEAEKMNRIALSFAGYIGNSSATRSNTVVSINKTSIREAIKSCADLEELTLPSTALFTTKIPATRRSKKWVTIPAIGMAAVG